MSQFIYYSAAAYSNIHEENTNSSFRNTINTSSLNYLPQEPLEAAIISLSFTLKSKITHQSLQLGIRSSISKDFCINGSSFDNILYTFTLQASLKTNVSEDIDPLIKQYR